jgi:hypothetical protein
VDFLGWSLLAAAGTGWFISMLHFEQGKTLIGYGMLAGSVLPSLVGCFLIWLSCKYRA